MRDKGISRKIHVRMWGDEKFNKLSKPQPNAQTLWIYLMTGPHNTLLPGIFVLGEKSLAEYLEWDEEATKEKLQELLDQNMIEIDRQKKIIVIATALKFNPPESPYTPSAWAKQFASLPECPLKNKFLKYLVDFMSKKAGIRNNFLKEFAPWLNGGMKDSLIDEDNKPDPRVNEFLHFYNDEFSKRFNSKPLIHGGKDGKHIKDLLRIKDLEELKNILTEYFNSTDKFIRSGGYTIGVFYSTFNKFLTKKSRFSGLRAWAEQNIEESSNGNEGQKRIPKISNNNPGSI